MHLRNSARKFLHREFKAIVLDDDNLMVESEHDVFNAVTKWTEADQENRREHYPRLMGTVRLSEIEHTVGEITIMILNKICIIAIFLFHISF